MKRKVIQIANSTQLVSLPRKWAQKYGIKKGDELDVKEKGSAVVVSLQEIKDKPLRAELNIGNMGRTSKRVIGALYRGGYDEIHIKFAKSDDIQHVQDILRGGCIGFEMVEQGRNYCVVRKVSDALYNELDSMFRRCFLFLISISKESFDVAEKLDKSALDSIKVMDKNITKFTDFCGRVLRKQTQEKHIIMYHIMEELERMGDEYKKMCGFIVNNKIKINNDTKKLYKDTTRLLEMLQDLFYKFDLGKMAKFYEDVAAVEKAVKKQISKTGKQECQIMDYIMNILNILFHLDIPVLEHAFINKDISDILSI
ncbi:AbrB/MazE/SpoVT family DNA-binding domain-containing protein [Candidatus Woesearchaeota archaeon]|nr:AbrB/MazE/SpoVT family DNA-binding domain-containing protein [Candidatus Woesearchaeota archaeon]MBW3006465.1 AbrB/MazE/SpoVT family DNA-binding domain-containing protein [Candidatus Woesearchaeota archaeon]